MRTFVFDPSSSGVSGDMLLAVLFAAGAKEKNLRKKFAGLADVDISRETLVMEGKNVSRMSIEITPDIHSPSFGEMRKLLDNIDTTKTERGFALKVLKTLEKAEEAAHGGVHPLHELGSLDTLVDVVGVAHAAENLGVFESKVLSLPVAIGEPQGPHQGQAVGVMLKGGIPHGKRGTKHELTTPTGLSILSNLAIFVKDFSINGGKNYYSIGTAELPKPHILNLTIL
ncbi:MAG: DUF111 family protein [Candidatus Altiarchaeota archaeon]|nr:DUF111 family protein [Candidatus Altiarchaeota archaeon]